MFGEFQKSFVRIGMAAEPPNPLGFSPALPMHKPTAACGLRTDASLTLFVRKAFAICTVIVIF